MIKPDDLQAMQSILRTKMLSDKAELASAVSKIPIGLVVSAILGFMIWADYSTEKDTNDLIRDLMTRQVEAFESMEANEREHNRLVESLLEKMGC